MSETTAKMEINSRYCEVSTYAASSGYNSSTASSSLNYIDVDNLSVIDNHCDIIDTNNNSANSESNQEENFVTKLIITITLVKSEQVVFRMFLSFCRGAKVLFRP